MKERRAARDGRSVSDWTRCIQYMEKVFPTVKHNFECFLERFSHLRGICTLEKGPPPKISIEFWRTAAPDSEQRAACSQGDGERILGLMYSLCFVRKNIRFEQLSVNAFGPTFMLMIRSYLPYMDRQTEFDLFSPIGGNASPPLKQGIRWRRRRRTCAVKWETEEGIILPDEPKKQ